MIFGSLNLENIVQTYDKTRLNASGSFVEGAEMTLMEIQPETGEDFYAVSADFYLDWAYSTAGIKTVTLRITTDGAPDTFTREITAITESDDNLFSDDSQLVSLEDDIMSYTRKGRNSFLDKHRLAQGIIIDTLDSKRIWKDDGSRYTASDLIDIQDFISWSVYIALTTIFESLSNQPTDIYAAKALKYNEKVSAAATRSVYRLDGDADGSIDVDSEIVDNFTADLRIG